jgi:hypothetical protein
VRNIRRSTYSLTAAFLLLGATVGLALHRTDEESKARIRSECESRAASRQDLQQVLIGILEKFPQTPGVLKIEDQVRTGLDPIRCP